MNIPKHRLNFAIWSVLSLLVKKLLSIILLISLFAPLTINVEEACCSPGVVTHLVKQAVGITCVIQPVVDI